MPKFTFEALEASGKTVRGELRADTRDAALEMDSGQGLFPRKTRRAAGADRRPHV
jgi:type II secretory pathway component PulF